MLVRKNLNHIMLGNRTSFLSYYLKWKYPFCDDDFSISPFKVQNRASVTRYDHVDENLKIVNLRLKDQTLLR